jgi:hypothetical protein
MLGVEGQRHPHAPILTRVSVPERMVEPPPSRSILRGSRMTVDERARHRLYRRLEEVLGTDEAGVLMNHLPPVEASELVTKQDLAKALEGLKHELTATIERSARRLVMWTTSVVLAGMAMAFAIGRFV